MAFSSTFVVFTLLIATYAVQVSALHPVVQRIASRSGSMVAASNLSSTNTSSLILGPFEESWTLNLLTKAGYPVAKISGFMSVSSGTSVVQEPEVLESAQYYVDIAAFNTSTYVPYLNLTQPVVVCPPQPGPAAYFNVLEALTELLAGSPLASSSEGPAAVSKNIVIYNTAPSGPNVTAVNGTGSVERYPVDPSLTVPILQSPTLMEAIVGDVIGHLRREAAPLCIGLATTEGASSFAGTGLGYTSISSALILNTCFAQPLSSSELYTNYFTPETVNAMLAACVRNANS